MGIWASPSRLTYAAENSHQHYQTLDIHAKEVIFRKENGNFIFPVADGRIKTLGEDQELRTSTLIRPRPIQGEGHVDFLGESEGSFPQPHDSFPDAGETINDFWSMSGNFIFRHHVEPRVKLHSPREELFPIPLKYIDVSRTTHTNLDVKQEKRIDDYWNIGITRHGCPCTVLSCPHSLCQDQVICASTAFRRVSQSTKTVFQKKC